jgi:outer membrane protein OmpA-like peptidoglycan-associated protein
MKALGIVLAFSVLLIFLNACSTTHKNLFVLIPDPDGRLGEIIITNKGGSEVIARPGYATEVKDANVAPSEPFPLGESQINKIFGAALAAQPEPPIRYILYFNAATADLTENFEKLIPGILSTIEARKSRDVSIVGHTDRVGSRQLNDKLGLERAVRIKEILISKGVDPSIIDVSSHGEDNPLIQTEDGVLEPLNRRVEVTIR